MFKRIIKCLPIFVVMNMLPLSAQQWTSYTTDNGLPHNEIRTVFIEPGGVKWFGTADGLVRFDGSDFMVFKNTAEQQTLADNGVNDIAYEESDYGPEIWVATDNGITVMALDGYTFATPYRTDNRPMLSNQINAVAVDGDHVKWFGTDKGVNSFTGEDWSEWSEPYRLEDYIINTIAIQPEMKQIFIGTQQHGVSRIFEDEIDGLTIASPYDEWSGLWSKAIYDAVVNDIGYQWYATGEGAAYHYNWETKDSWDVYFEDMGMLNDVSQAIAWDPDGSVWIGTPSGVSHLKGGIFTNYTVDDGLVSDHILSIAVDTDGTLWFGTDGGVTHFDPSASAVNSRIKGADTFELFANYPNPFNPGTTIGYQISIQSDVNLSVYNVMGQQIRALIAQTQTPGVYHILWNGISDDGSAAQAGIYVAELTVKNDLGVFRKSHKMLMIK